MVVIALLVASAARASASSSGAITGATDYGVDTNGDKLYNYLDVKVELSITVGGWFKLEGHLRDSTLLYDISYQSSSGSLPSGPQTVVLAFPGPDIYNSAVDGPYYVQLYLWSDTNALLSNLTHVTSAYGYKDFQPYNAVFVPPASASTPDANGNGLYDSLVVTTTVDCENPGTYRIRAHLTDQAYRFALDVVTAYGLASGRAVVSTTFSGPDLYANHIDGPYLVSLYLQDGNGSLQDYLFYTTPAYASSSFERPPAILQPPSSDEGLDTNGDGLYDYLVVEAGVNASLAMNVSLSATLYSPDGVHLIAQAITQAPLARGFQSVALRLPGTSIHSSQVNGSYVARIEMRNAATAALMDKGSYQTAYYGYTQFQPKAAVPSPPYSSAPVDLDNDGKHEQLAATVPMNVTTPEMFRMTARLSQGTRGFIETVNQSTWLPAGPNTLTLDFDGGAILRSQLDGPYTVHFTLYDAANRFIASDHFTTGNYTSSGFEPCPATFAPPHSDRPLDLDGDGRYEYLQVNASVNATAGGAYTLRGQLFTASGLSIGQTSSSVVLPPGRSTVPLIFDGGTIAIGSADGPYIVGLTILSGGSVLATDVEFTAPYDHVSFVRPPSATITGEVLDSLTRQPVVGARVRAAAYATGTTITQTTDSNGSFTLAIPAGPYGVEVTAAGYSPYVVPLDVVNGTRLAVRLREAVPDWAKVALAWSVWGEATYQATYLLRSEGMDARFRADWDLGNRDGQVSPAEASNLLASLSLRDPIASEGSTASFLTLDGAYLGQGPGKVITANNLAGPVFSPAVPYLEVRANLTAAAVQANLTHTIALTVPLDDGVWTHTYYLTVGPATRVLSISASADVYVYARRLPVNIVQPGFPSRIGETNGTASITYRADPPPGPPTNLTASRHSRSSIKLAWTAPTENMDGTALTDLAGFFIYRSTSGMFVRLNDNPVTSTEYVDSAVVRGVSYTYRVTAVDSRGQEGPPSEEASFTLGARQGAFALSIEVVDDADAPVARASATLLALDGTTLASGATDEHGLVVLTGVVAGTYHLMLKASGFEPTVQTIDVPTAGILVVHLLRVPQAPTLAAAVAIPAALTVLLILRRARRRR